MVGRATIDGYGAFYMSGALHPLFHLILIHNFMSDFYYFYHVDKLSGLECKELAQDHTH